MEDMMKLDGRDLGEEFFPLPTLAEQSNETGGQTNAEMEAVVQGEVDEHVASIFRKFLGLRQFEELYVRAKQRAIGAACERSSVRAEQRASGAACVRSSVRAEQRAREAAC
jgi:hypothetical protein